jgi:hypothetical protein
VRTAFGAALSVGAGGVTFSAASAAADDDAEDDDAEDFGVVAGDAAAGEEFCFCFDFLPLEPMNCLVPRRGE